MAEISGMQTAPKRAMVLAAGLGTRMRAFNGHLPKRSCKSAARR